MTTRFRSVSVAAVALVASVGVGTTACGKYSYGALKAKKSFLDGNVKYGAEQWKGAVDDYEAALAADPDRMQMAHFYLAYCYDNLYKASRKGEADNDRNLTKAIEHYKEAAKVDPNPEQRKLAMRFLVSAYGPDKLNDPSQSEPIIKQMVELEPNDPTNYFGLSKMYEDAGRYDEAEQALLKAKDVKPDEPTVYTTLSGYYNRQGDFTKTIEYLEKAAELDAKNPQGFHLIATFYEEKVRKDFRLSVADQKDYATKGIAVEDKALALNPNYVDAMFVKNILLRRLALTETTDRAKQAAYIKQAEELYAKADALRKGVAGAAKAGAKK